MLPLPVSFGLDEFSVSPVSVLSVRCTLSELDRAACNKIAEKEVSAYLASL